MNRASWPPSVHSAFEQIFELWTNFDLEYLSDLMELSFQTDVLHRSTSWRDTPKIWIKLDEFLIFCKLSTIWCFWNILTATCMPPHYLCRKGKLSKNQLVPQPISFEHVVWHHTVNKAAANGLDVIEPSLWMCVMNDVHM